MQEIHEDVEPTGQVTAMTARYVLSPRAQGDLNEIWDYSAETWGEDRAERYIRDVWRAIELVAEHPGRGRACGDI